MKRTWLLLAALSLLPATEALAAAPDEIAKEEFRQGRDAFKQGDYKTALPHFRKSQELFPQLGTLLNLASCEEKLGMVSSARKHFEQALTQLPERDDRLAFTKQQIAALAPRVPRLRIKLAPSAPDGARVALDDAPLSRDSMDTDLPIDPGDHVVVVQLSGRLDRRYEVPLKEGESSVLTVEPTPSSAPPEPARGGFISGKRVAGFVVGGVGVVGIGVGAVTGGLALATKSELNKLCPVPAACTQAGVDKAAKGKTLSVVSTVGFITGALATGAGVILVITGGSSAPKPVATLGAVALPGGGAVGLGGSF